MRRRPQTPETPWWLRRPNPNASSAPPLPPEAVRYLQEEDKRRWAHIEALHKKNAVEGTQVPEAALIVDNVADDKLVGSDAPGASANEASSPEPVASSAPVVANEAPPSASPDPAPSAPEPLSAAPESIDQTFDAIAKFIRKHLVCSDHQVTVLTLWVVHTYCFDLFAATPYLNIVSPENQSGKTICLQLLSLLSCKPWMPSGIPKSRIVSRIAKSQPTLLLDDWDTIFRPSDAQPIVGFLNAGSTGGHRNAVDSEHDDSPATFCPKAFAGLGCLPASLADRCLPITLQRKKPRESVHPFWLELYRPKATSLVEPLPAWVEKNGQELMFAAGDFLYEPLPDGFTMRQRDFIGPLLAIAKVAGGPWLRKARTALRRILNTAPVDPPSNALQLLSDIRGFFTQENDPPRIRTADLLNYLNRLEGRPWEKQSQQLTPVRLRNLLRHFLILRSWSQRKGKDIFPGFTFRHFVESWQRYLPHLSSRRSPRLATGGAQAEAVEVSGPQVATSGIQVTPAQAVTNAPQALTSDPQGLTNDRQGLTNGPQGLTNDRQGLTNSRPETEFPNVFNTFNICGDPPANSKSFQPEKISEAAEGQTEELVPSQSQGSQVGVTVGIKERIHAEATNTKDSSPGANISENQSNQRNQRQRFGSG
jgi:hypothetical protein